MTTDQSSTGSIVDQKNTPGYIPVNDKYKVQTWPHSWKDWASIAWRLALVGGCLATLVGVEVYNYRQRIVEKYSKEIDGKNYLVEEQSNGNKVVSIEKDGKYINLDEYLDENARAQKDELVKKLQDK